jgi:hypothetical protein
VADTVQTWVDRTRSHLMSGRGEERNLLAAGYTAGSGLLVFSNALGGIVPGSRISVGLNTFYVSAINETGSTATVIGAQEGTTDANASLGALVRVSPRFTDAEIFNALRDELSDLSAPDNGLFHIAVVDLTYVPATGIYEIAGDDLIDLYEVRYLPTTVGANWGVLPKSIYRLDRFGSLLTAFATLALLDAVPPTGSTLRALVRRAFTIPTALSDLCTTTNLPSTAWDIPPLGAAMRLVAPREVKRNFNESQGDTRRAGEVPPGAVANSFRPLAAMRMQRIQAEAARLTARYPDRRL